MIFEQQIFAALVNIRFDLSNEKLVQAHIHSILQKALPLIAREYELSEKDRIDFFIDGCGIEVKIKGSRADIYRQLLRYTEHDKIKSVILVTARSMGLPGEINKKPVYYFNLSKAWL